MLALRGLNIRVSTQAGNRVVWRADQQGDVVYAVAAAAGVITQIITAFRFVQALAVGGDVDCFAADAVFG